MKISGIFRELSAKNHFSKPYNTDFQYHTKTSQKKRFREIVRQIPRTMKNWGSILKMLIIRREERSVLVEFAAVEEAAGEHHQEQGAGDLREGCGPEGGGIGDEFCQHAAEKNADAHAEIPRG